jgi:hypothetical protein
VVVGYIAVGVVLLAVGVVLRAVGVVLLTVGVWLTSIVRQPSHMSTVLGTTSRRVRSRGDRLAHTPHHHSRVLHHKATLVLISPPYSRI